jgi:hypothetical protein
LKSNIPICSDLTIKSGECPHRRGKKCYLWKDIPNNSIGCPSAIFFNTPEKVSFT